MQSKMQIGFSQRVKYEWLEYTAQLCVAMKFSSVPESPDYNGMSQEAELAKAPRRADCQVLHQQAKSQGTNNHGHLPLSDGDDNCFQNVLLQEPVDDGIDKRNVANATEHSVGRAPLRDMGEVSAETNAWFMNNQNKSRVKQELREHLSDQLSIGSDAPSGSREKTVTILSRIWSSVPSHLVELRDHGLELYSQIDEPDRLVLHWGMTTAVYPFVFNVAETVGRLLRLQKTVTLSQVRERIEDVAGQRPTVYWALPKVVRSFVDWGVLTSSSTRGVYAGAVPLAVGDETLIAWLIEATLHAKSAKSLPMLSAVTSPGLFPFSIEPGIVTDYVIRKNPRLTTFRQGVSEEMVGLAEG